MEKTAKKEKDISFVLDARTVTKQGRDFLLLANKSQCQELAEFYELPAVKNLSFEFNACLADDVIELTGVLKANIVQTCVVTSEEFEENINYPFVLLFSEDENIVLTKENKIDFSPDDECIELIKNGRIYFSEIVREQFGLSLNPFPKKTEEPFAYYEEKVEDVKENPFAVLKHLTK